MKLKKLSPHSPKVIDAVVARIERMTPEEALAFLLYKEPGIEETDMLGILGKPQEVCEPVPVKYTEKAA